MPRFGRKRTKPSVITLADQARDQGQWERAAGHYREALQRRPQNPPIWVQFGHVLKEAGHWAEAERAYRTAMAQDPASADPHLHLGHILKIQGRKEEARTAYLRAVAIDPSLDGVSFEFSQLGWSEAHVSALKAMLQSDALHHPLLAPDGQRLNGVAAHSIIEDSGQQVVLAENQFDGSSSTPPTTSTSKATSRADVHTGASGSRRGSNPPRRGLIGRRPGTIALADRARNAGQWERAARLYRKALDRNPRNAAIWVQYGHALKELGELRDPDKLAQAEVAYRRAIALEPGAADPYLQLGHALKLQGKTEEAQAAYLRAFALDPLPPHPLEELGGLGWSEVQAAELRAMAAGRIGDKTAEDRGGSLRATVAATAQHRTIDLDEWRSEVVLGDPALAVALDRPIGIFVHLFYEDLAQEIAEFLARIDLPKKIYVSTSSDEKRRLILRAFEKFDLMSLTEIAIVPDYGLDIAPLLITYIDKLSEHDICLKVHGKKSLNMPTKFGEGWRRHLYDELIGNCERIRAIVATMLVDTDLGLLMAQHYPQVAGSIGMGENVELVRKILGQINVELVPNQKLEFPSGSMFWFRSYALAGLAGLGFDWHDFGHAADARDGTIAHAMERCFLFFCANAGKKWGFLPSRANVIDSDPEGSPANPVFSVIIPVYDRTWELREALDSVLSQSFLDFEVIIVTDATPPETMEIVFEYIEKDQRVRAFSYADNSGYPHRGRNRGILEARGEFISLLDSDDQYFPDTLEKAHRIFREREVDFVCGRAYYIVDGTRRVGDYVTGSTNQPGPITVDRLIRENPIQTCTVHIRRDLLLEFGGFRLEQEYLEDLELWLRLAYHGCRFFYSDELFAKYRFHQGNLELKNIDQMDYWLEHMRNNYLRPFEDWGIGPAADPAALHEGEIHDAVPVWPGRVDAEWYLLHYPDVARSGLDPLDHFVKYGRREGRKPNAIEAKADRWILSVTDAEISCVKRPVLREEVALFVTHCPHGRLKPYVRHYLDCLTRQGIAVILIVVADEALAGADTDLRNRVDGIYVRQNIGYDYAAWAHVFRLHPELTNASILYLLNDSVFGPTNDAAFSQLLKSIRNSSADVIGLTESFEHCWHLQSYFLAFKSQALSSVAFREFMESIVCYRENPRERVIASYELRLATIMKIAGLKCEAMFRKTDVRNPTIYHWRHLLDAGFPFLKVATVRDAYPGVDVADWRQVLAAQGYDVSIAERTLDEAAAGRRQLQEEIPASPAGLSGVQRSPAPIIGPRVATRHQGTAHSQSSGRDILIFTHELSSSGAPRIVYDMANCFLADGWYVAVISPEDGVMRQPLLDLGANVTIDPLALTGHHAADDVARNFDVVILNTIVCWRVARALNSCARVFWYVHESDLLQTYVNSSSKFAAAFSEVSGVWVGSPRSAAALRALGVEATVVEYGIENWPQQDTGRRNAEIVISLLGAVEPRKGQDLAILGFHALPVAMQHRCEMRFAGRVLDMSFYDDIRKLAGDDPRIKFLNELTSTEYAAALQSSDIILCPSRDDTLPLVSLHALAAGKLLICSKEVGTADYLRDGISGFILPRNTPNDISIALKRAIELGESRSAIGTAARQLAAEHFSQERFVCRLRALVEIPESAKCPSGNYRIDL
jgi:lipopolysaccharide biosynthesis protein/glycosyltransferase involved in cell wall biosynthesis/tetratricopeptide (TPR) repeat protein